MNSENENSIYNYNMIFNKVNNVNSDEDTDFNTNLISDINLQNFDIKRYEYYTNLIYIYKKDPDTLYNLLNKYYNIKNFKKKEKNIIKYISNYAKLLKDNDQKQMKSSKYDTLIKSLTGDVNVAPRDNSDKKNSSHGGFNGGLDVSQISLLEEFNIKKEELEKIIKMLNKTEIEIAKQEELINNEDGIIVSNILNKTLKPAIDIVKKIKDINLNDNDINLNDNDINLNDNAPSVLNKTLKPTIDIVKKLLKRKGGGFSNDDLKIKYLDTQKYKKLNDDDDLKKLKELRKGAFIEDDSNKIGKISLDIDNYYAKDKEGIESNERDKDDKEIIKKIYTFENDPKNPLEELELKFDDRIIFIIATFFIRYITIIMVQWCIDINIIKTFYEGFIYYAFIYIIIFWFIVLFINIDNSFDVKYMNFNGIINSIRTLFYYFYMGTNGISRLLIHTSLILILIIIPIILNIKKKAEFKDDEQIEIIKILNYDERKQLSKSLSLFTMFIWLFTSIIATKF
jgi:hypothetical protein